MSAAPSEENFTYDSLNRLLTSDVASTGLAYNRSESVTFDALGNISSKNGAIYHYTGCVTQAPTPCARSTEANS